MKKLIFIYGCLLLFSFSSLAQVNLSGLYIHETKPTVENIKDEFFELKKIIKDVQLTKPQQEAFLRLEESMKTQKQPKTLEIQPSQGPSWRQLAIHFIGKNYELNTGVDHMNDDGFVNGSCGFVEPYLQDNNYSFTWESIKQIKGEQSPIAYVASLNVTFYEGNEGDGAATETLEPCVVTHIQAPFEAKLREGKPVPICGDDNFDFFDNYTELCLLDWCPCKSLAIG